MRVEPTDDQMNKFFAWMDELNVQAVERGDWELPLCDEIAHSRNCWIADFLQGLTPLQALDADRV